MGLATAKQLIYWPIAWPALIAYFLLRGEGKKKLLKDMDRYHLSMRGTHYKSAIKTFYWLFCGVREFRDVFYMRIHPFDRLIYWILPGMPTCYIASTSKQIAGGLFVAHGWAMVINAERVGKNLWINQGVTIGHGRGGHPTIGDNVRIGSGAVVLGGITIGDNVNIGANAIVVDDVPANTTVCSPKAVVIRHHDGPTMNAMME